MRGSGADCFSLVVVLGLDGYVARKLNQTSAFGAWFDVVIDILSRGMLWSNVYTVSISVFTLKYSNINALLL